VVTADFLNAVNKHHHSGRDVDGEGALPYAADTGSADAYAIVLDPALTALIPGMPIFLKAANTNTGASTINVNGLGAVAIKKNVSTALAAGDIVAGQVVCVTYDGTNFQLVNNGQSVDLSQFPSSLVAAGWKKIPDPNSPSGGFIIQWGMDSAGTTLSGITYSFPIAFPNGCLSMVITDEDTGCLSGGVTPISASQFTIFARDCNGAYTAGAMRWIAIGY